MKKLVLLAVVVFGFAAMSFAQPVSVSAGVNAQVQVVNPNASLWIGALNDMEFGLITNNAPDVNHPGIFTIDASGNVTQKDNVTSVGTVKAAAFSVKGAGTTVNLSDIVVSPDFIPNLAGGTGYFETTNSRVNNSVTVTSPNGTGEYTIKVGGRLTLPKGANGAINITNLTVTVNNH